MVARTARNRGKSRDRWSQIGISACVLLLPPIAIGAAAYAMLPSREEIAAPVLAVSVPDASAPVTSVGAGTKAIASAAAAAAPVQSPASEPASPPRQMPAPVSTGAGTGPHKDPARVGEQQSRAIEQAGQTPPLAAPESPAPGTSSSPPAAAAASTSGTYALASAAEQPVERDLAQVMGPVPVHVTVLVAPNAAHAGHKRPDATETGPPSGEPPLAMLEEPAPDPPRRIGVDTPAEGRAARPSHHLRKHFARHVAHRNASREDTRGRDEARVESKPQRSFSLRNWLQQLGSRQRPAQQRG